MPLLRDLGGRWLTCGLQNFRYSSSIWHLWSINLNSITIDDYFRFDNAKLLNLRVMQYFLSLLPSARMIIRSVTSSSNIFPLLDWATFHCRIVCRLVWSRKVTRTFVIFINVFFYALQGTNFFFLSTWINWFDLFPRVRGIRSRHDPPQPQWPKPQSLRFIVND